MPKLTWTEAQLNRLADGVEDEESDADIALAIGKTPAQVKSKRHHLGNNGTSKASLAAANEKFLSLLNQHHGALR